MYQIIVRTFWGEEIDALDGAYDLKGKITIQTDGNFSCKMDWEDFRNNYETVKMFNLLEFQRFNNSLNKWEYVSTFVITDIEYKENYVELKADEWLKFFKHRYTRSIDTYSGEPAEDVVESLLDYTNSIGTTPIKMGIKESDILVDFDFKRQRIFDSWKNIAGAAGCDVWIDKTDDEWFLNVGVRGENKTDEVPAITYDYHQPETMNVQKINASYGALDFATRVIGKSSEMESIQEVERDGFPVIEKIQNFSGVASLGTLDLRVEDYLEDISSTLPKLSVDPSNTQVLLEEIKIGDYVPTYCRFKSFIIEADMRIVEIKFNIGDNLEDKTTLSLSQTKNFRTTILDVIGNIEKRINEI